MLTLKARALEAYEVDAAATRQAEIQTQNAAAEGARAKIASLFTTTFGDELVDDDAITVLGDADLLEQFSNHIKHSDGAWDLPYAVRIDDLTFVAFAAGALYVVNDCPRCQQRWAESTSYGLVHIGESIAADHRGCPADIANDPPLFPGDKKLTAPEARHALSVPRVAVDGGSDSDNLAVVAHNLGVIAQSLYELFDCGASSAGRGI